jgi:ABC-2 type transport system ATP-binding protein
MKRKLTIAAGIIHKPEILFLDEPTTGIDVASARQLRQLIDELHHGGTTIFLTTHYIEEAERLCDRIAFVVSGRIVRIDTVERLIQPMQSRYRLQIAFTNGVPDLQGKLEAAFPELDFQVPAQGLLRVASGQAIGVGPLVRFLEERGTEVSEARRLRPTLEDVFVHITGIEAGTMHKERERTGGGA